ncbi:uroporphyrinogen decarboxylase family protein [Sporomusa acidovorans]|uniref:Uroporphyrinogen decarboxylase n=1 Tax=Sporomusa acidovorans (strain ATCC 49682 / DSM 3132 / Mol) TaxID=1123286 RepID=A0ABZ3J7T4_SPOA4|nr:uroporphyrinogen decarboxylase family protein [Sporomusa acidovorans]OZC16724.1 uroporphyrinogen decarboxylase [Sporomusa acidovorans DSM 3132]SDE04704.1 uroporphyrinogen decarboxylase [Sporomusa acidovorans]
MEHRTRVERAIKRLTVDQVPCAELIINDKLVQTMFPETTIGFSHRLEFVNTLGLDATCLHPGCQYSPATVPCAKDVVFYDAAEWVNTDLFTFAVLDGPVGWGTKLLGFEQVMMQMTRHSQAVCELAAAVETMNKELINRLAGSGVNGIILADDIAFTQGLMVRPSVLREMVFPSLAAQAAYAKQLGLPVFFHSDGNLTLVLDDIAAAGFDGLQCIEALAGMDIGEVKKQVGDRLCLWGNLDPAELIEPRSVSQLEQTVRQIVQAAGHDGGLIFGTSSGLFENMRLDSLKVTYEMVRKS